jgi:hypothetical protein
MFRGIVRELERTVSKNPFSILTKFGCGETLKRIGSDTPLAEAWEHLGVTGTDVCFESQSRMMVPIWSFLGGLCWS